MGSTPLQMRKANRSSRLGQKIEPPAPRELLSRRSFAFVNLVVLCAVASTAQAGGSAPVLTETDTTLSYTCGSNVIGLQGDNIQEGATVKLFKAGEPDIVALQVTTLSHESWSVDLARCLFDIPEGTAGGLWSIMLTNPDAQPRGGVCCEFEETGVELVPKGVWGGSVQTVFVNPLNPNRVYIGSGRRLVILDITDNASGGVDIVEVGSIDLGNLVRDIAVKGRYAYVATEHAPNHFCVVDVLTNPAQPELIWNSAGTSLDRPKEVELYGDWAYVRNDEDLRLVNISTPQTPNVLGVAIQSIVGSVAIANNKLYIVTNSPAMQEIRIYDLANPALTFLGSAAVPGPEWQGTSIAVAGNYAYATTAYNDGVFAVFDVTVPATPVLRGSLDGAFQFAVDVDASGTIAYVADPRSSNPASAAQGLAIIDVSNPQLPNIVDSFTTHSSALSGIEVLGDRAYFMDDGEGLLVLDISSPNVPTILGKYHSPAFLRKMAKEGDLLYVTDEFNGFTILDVSNPDTPQLVGVHQTADGGLDNWGIDVRDGLAYLSAGWGGLEVADVTDPVTPSLAGSLPFNPGVKAVAMDLSPVGDVAHVGTCLCSGGAASFLVNFDVSNLLAMVDLDNVFVGGGEPFEVQAEPDGELAHMTADGSASGGAGAIDVQPPNDISLLSLMPLSNANDLAVVGNVRYVADGDSDLALGGLYIQDVTAPANPQPLSHYPAKRATGVDATAGRAYFLGQDPELDFRRTLIALDTSDPTNPIPLDKLFVPGAEQQILVDGAHAYVTGDYQGLAVVKIKILGDFNCDGVVGSLDAAPFVSCLLGSPQSLDHLELADMNGDGSVDGLDTQGFVDAALD